MFRLSVQVTQWKYKRWPIAAMIEVHHMRFLLRPFALEVFLSDRSTALFSFPSAKARPFEHTYITNGISCLLLGGIHRSSVIKSIHKNKVRL